MTKVGSVVPVQLAAKVTMIHLVLYQPEIPQNVGTLIRLCSCLGVVLHIIEPCGFIFGDRRFRRAGMDYIEMIDLRRHESWQAFQSWHQATNQRLIATTTTAKQRYVDFSYHADDIILMGPESVGLPSEVVDYTTTEVTIPMLPGRRSINVAISAGMVVGEVVRQTNQLPW